jgi:hypothetical protein
VAYLTYYALREPEPDDNTKYFYYFEKADFFLSEILAWRGRPPYPSIKGIQAPREENTMFGETYITADDLFDGSSAVEFKKAARLGIHRL